VVAKRKVKKNAGVDDLLSAIATERLTDRERVAALGAAGRQINELLKDAEWRSALQKGAAAVDALALKHLYQLVSGEAEIIEDRFPIRDEDGNIAGVRKRIRPGPSLQACKFWIELRTGSVETSTRREKGSTNDGVAESKAMLISSILALIKPKDDPVVEDRRTGK
jgi:hypothetical protein